MLPASVGVRPGEQDEEAEERGGEERGDAQHARNLTEWVRIWSRSAPGGRRSAPWPGDWSGDSAGHLHPRPPRVGAALAPVAHRGELRRIPAPAPRRGDDRCSTSGVGRAPSPSTWPRPSPRGASSASTSSRSRSRRPGRTPRRGATRRRSSASATSTTSTCPTTRSTSSMRTRCSSTSATPSRRCGRCAGYAGPAGWWPSGTATTRRWSGTPPPRGSTTGSASTRTWPAATAPNRRPPGTCWPGRIPPGSRRSTSTASTWCYATPEERDWWGGLWADRITQSSLAQQALERGLATPELLDELARAWREWAAHPDGWFVVVHGEILARA